MRLLFSLLLPLLLQATAYADNVIIPRIGYETELARQNSSGQILIAPSKDDRAQLTLKILQTLQQTFGGNIESGKYGPFLKQRADKAGAFRIDADWASDLEQADAFELVTPPLDKDESDLYVANYDRILQETNLGPGLKTSQQYNIEVRELIEGLSLTVRPSDRLGIAVKDINNLNISKVVDYFLFCEVNVLYIYAASAPKRLGNLVNYFAVPMLFEHYELLKELAAMPEDMRTYQNVRAVLVKYKDLEEELGKYSQTKHGRTPWKYRPFNLRKLFFWDERDAAWVYPAIENRVPDTPASGEELDKLRQLNYAMFNVGSQTKITPKDLDGLFSNYRTFFLKARKTMPFNMAMRILNQDIVSQSLTKEFKDGYNKFLKKLNLSPKDYPAFKGAEPTQSISRTYSIYGLMKETVTYEYAGRKVTIPKIDVPWNLEGYSFGAEFEFTETPGILEVLKSIPFLETKVTTESTGNREVITKPTSNIIEYFVQIQYMRDVLGENLRSIHGNTRAPKSLYERIPKTTMTAWLGRFSDWITSLRANYRNPAYAFNTRTQNRMQIDTPNAWIANDKMEYRGTLRVLHVGDKINFEVRGLMNGVFKQHELQSDALLVATLILLTGLNQPEYIEGEYALRLLSEVSNPATTLRQIMSSFAESQGKTLDGLAYTPEHLVSALRAPDLMLLPLVGFEFMPQLSGHDAKRLKNAMIKWKFKVWEILENKNLTPDQAKAQFLDSLQYWSRQSGIEDTLFDSLLSAPAPGATWTDTNLPAEAMRAAFLEKILNLHNSEWLKAGFENFLVTWSIKDQKAMIAAAKILTEEDRIKLLEVLRAHKNPMNLASLAKKLGVKVPARKANIVDEMRTNLSLLLDRFSQTPSIEAVETLKPSYEPPPPPPQQPQPAPTPPPSATTSTNPVIALDLKAASKVLASLKNRYREHEIPLDQFLKEITPLLGSIRQQSLNLRNAPVQQLIVDPMSLARENILDVIDFMLYNSKVLEKLTIASRLELLKLRWDISPDDYQDSYLRMLNDKFDQWTNLNFGRGDETSLEYAIGNPRKNRHERYIVEVYLHMIEKPYLYSQQRDQKFYEKHRKLLYKILPNAFFVSHTLDTQPVLKNLFSLRELADAVLDELRSQSMNHIELKEDGNFRWHRNRDLYKSIKYFRHYLNDLGASQEFRNIYRTQAVLEAVLGPLTEKPNTFIPPDYSLVADLEEGFPLQLNIESIYPHQVGRINEYIKKCDEFISKYESNPEFYRSVEYVRDGRQSLANILKNLNAQFDSGRIQLSEGRLNRVCEQLLTE